MDAETCQRESDAWHAQRIARLTAPDGWLSLTGLEWLRRGVNRVGSAADNDVVLVGAPAHLGVVEWRDDGSVRVELAPAANATIDGGSTSSALMQDDSHAQPTRVAFGSAHFILIDREGRKGLRVRDSEAATRTGFVGIERFPVDPAWRVVADWQPLEPPFQLATMTVIGTLETHPAPGKAVFEHDGQRCEVYPMLESPGDAQLFLVFADLTSGKETYGASRFLYADLPREGKIVLDFNRAYNPPCAFTPFATCPLAPPENRLPVRVTAGELKYARGH